MVHVQGQRHHRQQHYQHDPAAATSCAPSLHHTPEQPLLMAVLLRTNTHCCTAVVWLVVEEAADRPCRRAVHTRVRRKVLVLVQAPGIEPRKVEKRMQVVLQVVVALVCKWAGLPHL